MTRWHLLLFNCISLLLTKVVTIEISCKKRKSQCSKFSATIRVRGFFKEPFFYTIYLELLKASEKRIHFQVIFSIKMSAHVQTSEVKSGIIFISRLIERRFCTCDKPQRWHFYCCSLGTEGIISLHFSHLFPAQFNPFIGAVGDAHLQIATASPPPPWVWTQFEMRRLR